MRKKTTEDFKRELYKKYKEEYELIGEYVGATTKVKIKHLVCGNEYLTYPTNILRGHGCWECFKHNKLNKDKRTPIEEVLKHIENEKGDGFVLLNHHYENGRLIIKTKHLKCGNINETTYMNFKNSIGCPHCAEKQRRKTRMITNEEFLKRVYGLRKNEYTFLENYKGTDVKIKVRHNICGHEYLVAPSKFLNKRQCPKCTQIKKSKSKAMSNFEFLTKVKELVGKEYSILGEYKRSNIKIKMKHNNCGHEWLVTPASFLAGTRCPKCQCLNSKGCAKIEKYLKKNNYKYKREFKFEKCKNKFLLPFDFAVFENDKVNFLIEYDGEQHFKPVKFFGGNKKFKERVNNDKIKNKFCENNGLKLLRIKYTDFDNIDKILNSYLTV